MFWCLTFRIWEHAGWGDEAKEELKMTMLLN